MPGHKLPGYFQRSLMGPAVDDQHDVKNRDASIIVQVVKIGEKPGFFSNGPTL